MFECRHADAVSRHAGTISRWTMAYRAPFVLPEAPLSCGVFMSRALRHLITMPLLAAVLTACGNGTAPVTSGSDPAGGGGSSGSSSNSSTSSSSSGSSSSGGSSSGGATTDVLTYHYDAMRTGQNL